MNSDHSALTILGFTDGKPVIIEIDTKTSRVKKFIELEVSPGNSNDVQLGAVYSDRNGDDEFLYSSILIELKP